MEKKVYVNGKQVKGIGFIWDGCHKIYIIQTPEELEESKLYGYTMDDFYIMERLKEIYEKSCPLRFIESFDLQNMKVYAPQYTYAIITVI